MALHKTDHYIYDSELSKITIREDQFKTAREVFDVMKRDHMSRILQKYPDHKVDMITRDDISNVINADSAQTGGVVITLIDKIRLKSGVNRR